MNDNPNYELLKYIEDGTPVLIRDATDNLSLVFKDRDGYQTTLSEVGQIEPLHLRKQRIISILREDGKVIRELLWRTCDPSEVQNGWTVRLVPTAGSGHIEGVWSKWLDDKWNQIQIGPQDSGGMCFGPDVFLSDGWEIWTIEPAPPPDPDADLIEQIAQVLLKEAGLGVPWEKVSDDVRDYERRAARAVLAVVRGEVNKKEEKREVREEPV